MLYIFHKVLLHQQMNEWTKQINKQTNKLACKQNLAYIDSSCSYVLKVLMRQQMNERTNKWMNQQTYKQIN